MFKRTIYDHTQTGSAAWRLRQKRHDLFLNLLNRLDRPVKILDAGGTAEYWQNLGVSPGEGIDISLVNLQKPQKLTEGFEYITGDIRNRKTFENHNFDVIFSNSVIEHLGSFENQLIAADNIRRSGARYFIQTPNFYFPIEPHFLVPGYQFIPAGMRIFLLRHFRLGWIDKEPDKHKAAEIVSSINLLTKGELQKLFPDAEIYHERILGITKSFIAYRWD